MPNKSRTYAIVLIILTLASLLSVANLALASPLQLQKVDSSVLSNERGKQAGQQVDHLAGVDTQIFLPIVSNKSGGIPVPNGDFESGPTIWTESSTNNRPLILLESAMPIDAHSGSWAAWLGGADGEISYIEQTLTVHAGTPHFTYWHWIDSIENFCGFDFAGIFVDGFLEDVYDLCSANNTSGWMTYSVDLSAYAGQTKTIQIWAETNQNQVSSLYVDDISFKAYPASSSLIKTRKVEK